MSEGDTSMNHQLPTTSLEDLTHLTGQFEANSSSVLEPAPPKFQIKMKEQSALEYIEDEVESIMSSSASKYKQDEDT